MDAGKVDRILEEVQRLVGDRFPKGKLKNRLLNLGLREFIDGVDPDANPDELAVHRYGFPFKFIGQLDEAILVLAHYLNRFRHEGGRLNVYGLNRLSKGEDKTLSFWQSEKSRLYVELQNLILLLNEFGDRESSVVRVFVFRDIGDLAFLTQPAVSVINEQLASDIKLGVLFLNEFDKDARIDSLSNTLIVDYQPADDSGRHNFYVLHSLLNEENMHDLPYQDRCMSKWFKNRKEAEAEVPFLEPMMGKIFDTGAWSRIDDGKRRGVVEYRNRDDDENFKNAAVMMFEAYKKSELGKNVDDESYTPEIIVDRMCRTVITADMLRLERAVTAFGNSTTIRAIDSTSVKNSLKIHEADPTYRRWVRTSLNAVLRNKSKKHLERIYILEDGKQSSEAEFQVLKRIMQYYFDYCHYDISEMKSVVHAHLGEEGVPPPQWLVKTWRSLSGRLKIHITTSSVLKMFAKDLLEATADPEDSKELRERPRMLEEITSASYVRHKNAHEALARLDYLFTEDMIYNFMSQRADPAELSFEAYLYRKSFDVEADRRTFFKFTGFEPGLKELEQLQMPHRLDDLAESIVRYADKHETMLGDLIKRHEKTIEYIKAGRTGKAQFAEADAMTFLAVRRDFEHALFKHFHPIATHLFELLKFLSVEVEFFKNMDEASVEKVRPFSQCKEVKDLTEFIKKKATARLASAKHNPARLPKTPAPDKRGAAAPPSVTPPPPEPLIFLSYASEDREAVLKVYDTLKDLRYNPWMDVQDIFGGENWAVAIKSAMKKAAIILTILSSNSVDKRGYVQREFRAALERAKEMLDRDIFLIPVKLDRCPTPDMLGEYHVIELFSKNGWPRLERAIKEGLERRKT